MEKISSRDNPIFKQLRSLQEKKYRLQHGLFVIEGRKLVMEALETGIVVQVFVDEDGWEAFYSERVAHPEVKWLALDRKLAAAAGDTVNPQGIIAAARLPVMELGRMLAGNPRMLLYLDHINDPGNLGSILRSAWALGIDGALLSPACADPFNPKVVRSAAGAVLHLPLVQQAGVEELAELCQQGFHIIGADAAAELPYYNVEYQQPGILAVGSEARGLTPEIRKLCGQLACIPMQAGAESLNAATAAAIFLADYARRYIVINPVR